MLNIEDYFRIGEPREGLTKREVKDFHKIREEINSHRIVEDQIRYIVERRSSARNRRLDNLYFGIGVNEVIDEYAQNINSFQENKNWNGLDAVDAAYSAVGSAKTVSSMVSGAIPALKVGAIIAVVILVINIVVYGIGVYDSIGHTPFDFCSDGMTGPSSIDFDTATKIKDGYGIPVDYVKAGQGYTGQNYSGPEQDRGIGVFASEDFLFSGPDDAFSSENYAMAARWEYVSYSVQEGKWPGHAAYGNGTSDGVDTSLPYTNLDSGQHAWTIKQKVLVHNPENGKSVVVMVGNGATDANWGGSPLNAVAGLSYLAQQALGFSAGGLEGEDYTVNSRDSGVSLEMWWVHEDTEVGPVGGLKSSGGGGGYSCSGGSSLGGGNASIADAAVSMAHETISIATPNSGANQGKGTDLYVAIHDKVIAGDPWYQSCDRFTATAVRWSGADDKFPAGSTGTILSYMQSSDKWEYVPAKGESDLLPGDIIIKVGHVMVYAGIEAVQKKYPNSTGVIAHASIGSASSPDQQSMVSDNRGGAVGTWWDMGLVENGGEHHVYRNVKTEDNSVYSGIRP